jgi:hypothetical protein
LSATQIVHGQWRALLRMFGPPLALWLVAQLLGAMLLQQMTWNRMAAATPATPTAMTVTNTAGTTTTNITVVTTTTSAAGRTVTVSAGGFAAPSAFATFAMSLAATFTAAANLVALSWFGMWMGLNSKNTNLATLKTIIFVQIIPWLVIAFASALIVPLLLLPRLLKGASTSPSQMMVWYPLIVSALTTVLYLAKDMAFVLWARRKLYAEFRERAVRAVVPIRLVLPPPSPPAAAPPVIAPDLAAR